MFHLVTIVSCLALSSLHSLIFMHIEILLSFLHADQSQLSQPSLAREMLWSFMYLFDAPLDSLYYVHVCLAL